MNRPCTTGETSMCFTSLRKARSSRRRFSMRNVDTFSIRLRVFFGGWFGLLRLRGFRHGLLLFLGLLFGFFLHEVAPFGGQAERSLNKLCTTCSQGNAVWTPRKSLVATRQGFLGMVADKGAVRSRWVTGSILTMC